MTESNFLIDRVGKTIIRERIYDASLESVFKAFTDLELIPQWWGPRNLTTTVDTMDVSLGACGVSCNAGLPAKNTPSMANIARLYHQSDWRYTFEFESMPGHVLLETVTFEESDGKTNWWTQFSMKPWKISMGCYRREWRKARPNLRIVLLNC